MATGHSLNPFVSQEDSDSQHGEKQVGMADSVGVAAMSVSSALKAAYNFTGSSASAHGATMQQCFVNAVVNSEKQHELLSTRLRGLSREWCDICDYEVCYNLGNLTSAAAQQGFPSTASVIVCGSGPGYVTCRVRRSLLPDLSQHCKSPILRYLGPVEGDKNIMRRNCLEIPVSSMLVNFLTELGFEKTFGYILEGQIYIRGRVKCIVCSVNDIKKCSVIHSDGVSQETIPIEWERISPHWLVEVSSVGSPADESLQNEVAEFSELLKPLVNPTKVDFSKLGNK